LKICNNLTANNIPENPASWADLDWYVRGGGGFLPVIWQRELAKGAGSGSNSCEQLLTCNSIWNKIKSHIIQKLWTLLHITKYRRISNGN
jgi:hypothetical protein